MKLSGQGQPVVGYVRVRLQSQHLRCFLVILVSTILLGAEPAAPVPADVDSVGVRLAKEYLQELEEKTRLTANSAFLLDETTLLSHDRDQRGNDRPIPLLESLVSLRPETQSLVLSVLEENADSVQGEIKKLVTESESSVQVLRESCLTTRSDLNSAQILLFEAAVKRHVAGQIASLINVDNRYLWLSGVLAVGALLLVRLHHYRHYYRRLSWIRRSKATLAIAGLVGCLCLVLVPTLLTFMLGNRTYESLIKLIEAGGASPQTHLETEVAKLQSDVVELRDLNNGQLQKRDELLAKRRQRIESGLKSTAPAIATAVTGAKAQILNQSQNIRDQVRELFVNSQVESALAKELNRELPELEKLKTERQKNEAAIRSSLWVKRLTGAGLGLILLGSTVWAGVLLERRIAREKKQLASTCPRCLARGKLQLNPNQQAPGGIVPVAIRELICTNIISEDPYEECEFTFLEQHRDRDRLTFPTLGVASSGKTVGMLMMYHQLRNGKCYGSGSFEKLSTAGSREFDRKVDALINSGIVPERTILGELPPPVVYNFCDSDRFGKSNALVNVFDYSGEITTGRMLTDAHRFRAMNGDGYFFFLDPTYPSQDQSDALSRFREDIKTLRSLGTSGQVHTPVALCISKIDLMVNQPYGQGDTILEFYEDLRKIEETTENGSLDRITKRSELVARLRHLIWPDWEIETQIRGLFGDRFMFFPMTPIGMDQLGETDISQRDLRPYCILEPMSWLLHMNGYPILKE
jgi:hypothetical protein